MASRTQKTVKNIYVSTIFLIVETILKFISRTAFINYLGAEILGLNTTIWNILNFLNLAELGVGTAITVTLYRPIFNNNHESINEIIALQGHFYKWISTIILGGGLIVMGFFPWIFEKAQVPTWTIYATFLVLLFSSLIGNFVNYRQTLLVADQKAYKIAYSNQSVLIIRRILQILAICYLQNGYVWWLVIEALFAVIGAVILRWVTNREYPYLGGVTKPFKELRHKYNSVSKKISQLIYHNITVFIVRETTPLIIYGFISLTEVAIYGNYMTVMLGLYQLSSVVLRGITHGVGNLVAEGNMNNIIKVYKELFIVRFILSSIIFWGLIMFMDSFIKLWVGKDYLLGNLTLWLMAGFLFIRMNRAIIDVFINAYGLYDDIKSPILEGIANLSLAIVGGYLYGLNGIIGGSMVGTLIVILIWKPYYLFHRGFKMSVRLYYRVYMHCALVFIPVGVIAGYIVSVIHINPSSSWLNLALLAIIGSGICAIGLTSVLYFTSSSMRSSVKRFV